MLGRLPGAVLSLARLRAVFHSAVLAPISLGVCNTESATSNSRCIGQRYVLPSKRPGSISSAADLQIGHVAIAFLLLYVPPSRSATNSLSSLASPNNAGRAFGRPRATRWQIADTEPYCGHVRTCRLQTDLGRDCSAVPADALPTAGEHASALQRLSHHDNRYDT